MSAALRTVAAGIAMFGGGAEAWGMDGHIIVAHIADSLLSSDVNSTLMTDLGTTSLSDAATWCDDFDHTPAGRWSEGLHYINYPGQSCNFQWDRDCQKDFCNVGAILNYSQQVWNKGISVDDRLVALKFMIHMVGDVHQPLHVASADDKGGNDIKIHYQFTQSGQDESDNLHQIWDSAIIIQMINDLGGRQLRGGPFKPHNWPVLAQDLLKHVTGDWSANVTEWRKSVAETKDAASLKTALTAVASETAADSCTYAYVSTSNARIQSGDDLKVDYYQRSKPVVAGQLVKAGARLAQILSDSLAATRAAEKAAAETLVVL